jgi:hypothetical protein
MKTSLLAGAFDPVDQLMLLSFQPSVLLAIVQGQQKMVLCPWVLESAVEVHWPLTILKESPLFPPLWMVLAPTSTLTLMEGVSEPLFWLGKAATTLCTTEGSGEPIPSVPVEMSHSA